MEILLIGLLMLAGLTLGVLASHFFSVPRVVGYILAGMLFSPGFLGGLLGAETTEWTRTIVAAAIATATAPAATDSDGARVFYSAVSGESL